MDKNSLRSGGGESGLSSVRNSEIVEFHEESAQCGTDRYLRGEIKTIRRLSKLHVRQLDRADARNARMEQRLSDIERKLGGKFDYYRMLFTLAYLVIFLVTWFFR